MPHGGSIVEPGHRVVGDVDDRDGGAGGREPVHERAADRAPAAGDQHALAGQPEPVRHRASDSRCVNTFSVTAPLPASGTVAECGVPPGSVAS